MQLFVGDTFTMIAAPVQCDVDGIPKGSHYVMSTADGVAQQTMPFTPPPPLFRCSLLANARVQLRAEL